LSKNKGLFSRFYPDEWVDSTYVIDFESFYKKGYRGLTFDIDNTLVPHGAPADERALELFKRLHRIGYRICLISNNKRSRVQPFAEAVDAEYIWYANKPSTRGYERACSLIDVPKEQTLFVGDQLFTDVWGAKRAGMYSILVKPIHPKEEIQIVIKRFFEKIVLHFYKKSIENKDEVL